MRIRGFIETSLLDWDKKVVSVIFVGGCNFRCPFCQNSDLANDAKSLPPIEWEDIKKTLEKKRKWLDGVVVSGGEPMMHPEIFGLLIKIKELGYKVKVDTNGYYPYPLKEAIELGLVDYVAMDIKTALDERYYKAIGRTIHFVVIERTIRLLKECGLGYEFRTTLVPNLVGEQELLAIAEKLTPAKKLVLQQYVPKNARLARYRKIKPYLPEQAQEFQKLIKKYFTQVSLRGY
ncbi:MAG: anaerobic ribonucleoside-triphosphate reductase activating protein [Candidatus Latescibacteria bacterium]|nr:anaerobic ribonucleoside-triphosphate reductase activating protein [Candidatus Latescibacterota bacterium]